MKAGEPDDTCRGRNPGAREFARAIWLGGSFERFDGCYGTGPYSTRLGLNLSPMSMKLYRLGVVLCSAEDDRVSFGLGQGNSGAARTKPDDQDAG